MLQAGAAHDGCTLREFTLKSLAAEDVSQASLLNLVVPSLGLPVPQRAATDIDLNDSLTVTKVCSCARARVCACVCVCVCV